MARYLIVDAHSVIFASPELRVLHRRRMLLAREALVKALTEYQDITGVRVVAVFDGQGEKLTEATEPGGIQIFYSGQGQNADAVIERLAALYSREHDLAVVTDDHLEQQTVSSFGATSISVEILHGLLEEARSGFQRELKRHRRK